VTIATEVTQALVEAISIQYTKTTYDPAGNHCSEALSCREFESQIGIRIDQICIRIPASDGV